MRGTQTPQTKTQRHICYKDEKTPAERSEYIDASDLSMPMSRSLRFIDDRDGVSDGNAQSGDDVEA